MVLRLRLLGTGTPTPLLDRAGASFLIECGDDRLLFDCGPGAVRRLLESRRPLPQRRPTCFSPTSTTTTAMTIPTWC